ncbi:STAS domain-containing protein [Citreimonas sp.]|uniref:STAS domain-containing protein n=1 Tax=Citreimonas sp. TaxID=3036715 RepID=UPI0035C7D78C
MKLNGRQLGDTYLVTVETARIDAAAAIRFREEMRGEIERSHGTLVLDLGPVEFIDSSGLGAIVAVMKLMPEGRRMELASLGATVDKVFRMTRMDSIFRIHGSVDEATGTDG